MKKKFLPYILLTAAAAFFALGPFGPNLAHAWNLNVFPSAKDIVSGIFAELGNLFLRIASIVLYFSGKIFDYAVRISVLNFSDYANMPGIMDGWRIVRDVMNLFFIFILLYIAIGTILQLAGFDTKKLLTSVIIVALLVNFSAVLTKVVIDASNVLALEFYQKIGQPSINGQEASLAGVFVSGLKLSTVYKPYDQNAPGPRPVKNQLSFFGVIMGTFGGVLVILITSFVLLMAAVLFIYRTVALLFLIVLSPLAFVAMAFPGMGSHAAKWRGQLFSQAFFAPAYLFMIYLVAKIITSQQGLAAAVGVGPTDGLLDALGGGSVKVMVYFAILIGFLVGSITVAKSMGANGAVMVEGWGKKLKGKAQGYAGGVAVRRLAPLAREIESGEAQKRAKWNPMRAAMWAARGAGKAAAKLPGARAGLQSLGARYAKDVGAKQKALAEFSSDELTRRVGVAMTNLDRAAIINELAKRGDIDKLTDEQIKRGKKLLSNIGMPTKDIDKLRPDLIPKDELADPKNPEKGTKREAIVKMISPSDIENMKPKTIETIFGDEKTRKAAMESFGPAHYAKMSREAIDKAFFKDEVIEDAIKNFSSASAKKLLDIGGRAEKAFFGKLAEKGNKFGGNIEAFAEEIQKENKSLASWLRSPGAPAVMASYGMNVSSKKRRGEDKEPDSGKNA